MAEKTSGPRQITGWSGAIIRPMLMTCRPCESTGRIFLSSVTCGPSSIPIMVGTLGP